MHPAEGKSSQVEMALLLLLAATSLQKCLNRRLANVTVLQYMIECRACCLLPSTTCIVGSIEAVLVFSIFLYQRFVRDRDRVAVRVLQCMSPAR